MKFIFKLIKNTWKFIVFFLMISVMAYGCHEKNMTATQKGSSAKPMLPSMSKSLTIYGYNYTNTYIDSYSLDGQEGGYLRVSGPTNGGGGSVCCFNYTPGYVSMVKVRWQSGGCLFDEGLDKKGKMAQQIHHFYKEAEVIVDSNVPENPHYFEVHIYPDDHVEAIITDRKSNPRLILKKDREINSDYKRCHNGKKPKE